jgi:hypothetical protein
VSVNNVLNDGGGILLSSGLLTISRSTVVRNTAATGSALWNGGTTVVAATVLAGTGADCSGSITSSGYNMSDDASCSLVQPTDHPDTVPVLGPLANNGGPTLTHLPGATSPLLDAIPVGTAGLCDATTPTDQRGFPRPTGTACDIGAVER